MLLIDQFFIENHYLYILFIVCTLHLFLCVFISHQTFLISHFTFSLVVIVL